MNLIFTDELEKELAKLVKEKDRLEQVYSEDDKSFLEIKKNKGKYTQFYKCEPLNSNGATDFKRTFIKKKDIAIASALAQKDFDLCVLKMAREKIDLLKETLLYGRLGIQQRMKIILPFMKRIQ